MSFEPAEPIDVGSPVNVIVTLPDDANGTVTLNFNGTKYVGEVVNGVANITVPNLGDGVHNFTVAYSGDGNYKPADKNSSVQFNKVAPAIIVNTTNITLGDVAVKAGANKLTVKALVDGPYVDCFKLTPKA